MSDEGVHATDLPNLLEHFYHAMLGMLPHVVNPNISEDTFIPIAQHVNYLSVNVFDDLTEPSSSTLIHTDTTLNGTMAKYVKMNGLLYELFEVLQDMLESELFSNTEITTAFKGFLHSFTAELFVVFQDMRQLASLQEEAIARYDDLFSSMESLSQEYLQILQSNSIPNQPDSRMSHLEGRLAYLAELILNEMGSGVMHNNDSVSSLETEDAECFVVGATQETIEANTISYRYQKLQQPNDDRFDERCAVCLGNIEENEDARRLPCMHLFHTECADMCLKVNKRCPICRRDIEGDDDLPLHLEENSPEM